ncbi:hypothetical protein A3G65_02290 [Candidatus Roizmanbacteria bacterium RIFCSPLOWO2_12_FULL_37_7b]|nr:MAG: hypothetical protein A3G65_02290 [Candidatus Roizmanbacteria bacterium RIFCSPLOWO2_12_FULL_37_7b]
MPIRKGKGSAYSQFQSLCNCTSYDTSLSPNEIDFEHLPGLNKAEMMSVLFSDPDVPSFEHRD